MVRGSNPRPTRCKRVALPAELTTHMPAGAEGIHAPKVSADPYIGPAPKKIAKKLAVHGVLKRSASLEFRLLRCSDLDGLASARVATGCSCTMCHRESTETDNTNLAAAFQRTFDARKHCINSTASICLGQARGISDSCNKIVFVHGYPQYLVGSTTTGVQRFRPNTKKKENAPGSKNLGRPLILEHPNVR